MNDRGLSSVVITYNRIDVVETCLRSARIADELIVVDKGSTDGTAEIGQRLADRFIQVPWSPTVEETRAEAVSLATAPWILSLDDDECLNGKAAELVLSAIRQPKGSIYYLPYRHHILGKVDERAYYWPEYRPSLFRRGTMTFSSVVHGGVHPASDDRVVISPDTGAAIMHLSHKDAATWIEKTNRYTSRPGRAGSAKASDVTPDGIMALMRTYLSKVPPGDNDGYLTAVAALRGLYDVVDAIKRWEAEQPLTGQTRFAEICEQLNAEYDALQARFH
nr:glycosyltransferase family 2 protein [uncultured Rhodopila sp.]